ncbi:MAG: Crp/Fnr family transcriptional regulator [Kiloniellales bacterium]|nr:Crp/Fnr family transcriptional regulator [Kiloniellales bacterium]
MTLTPPGRSPKTEQVKCRECPLRSNDAFRKFSEKELDFVQHFKSGEMVADAGTTIFLEGNNSAHLYTVLSGWVFRYKLLHDGRRQILNFGLPGDFFGLQTSIFGEMDHSVEALTDVVLCVFPREKVWQLYKQYPGLGFDLTWLAAREQYILDENLLTVGRRTAVERVASVLLHVFLRIEQLGMARGRIIDVPFTQQQLADALGLSHVHTNKTIKKLTSRTLIEWDPPKLKIKDLEGLAQVAKAELAELPVRPFI